MFEGECVPDLSYLEKVFNELDDDKYPHAWRGTVICFGVGVAVMAFTEILAILVRKVLKVIMLLEELMIGISLDHLLSRLPLLLSFHRL